MIGDVLTIIATAVTPIMMAIIGFLTWRTQNRSTLQQAEDRKRADERDRERDAVEREARETDYWREQYARIQALKDELMVEAAKLRQQVIERDARIHRLEDELARVTGARNG